MVPLWIIDLEEDSGSSALLKSLIDSLPEARRDYWYYSAVDSEPVIDIASLVALSDYLVSEGRQCYNHFTEKGYRIDNFRVAILGRAEEATTQSVFASIAGVLRDVMPRIVADHANLGLDITGFIFVPYTINQIDSPEQRVRCAMLLEELNTVVEQQRGLLFNRIVAYQDVQYKGVRFYPQLSSQQRMELLFQYLVNLFLCENNTPLLFDTVDVAGGMCSLGAAALRYNGDEHRRFELDMLMLSLLTQFRVEDNCDNQFAEKMMRTLMTPEVVSADRLLDRLREGCSSLDVNLRKMEQQADPHPVWNLFSTKLFPTYYFKYLRFMPARIVRFLQRLSYVLLSRFSQIVSKNSDVMVSGFRNNLRDAWRRTLQDVESPYTTIAQIKSFYGKVKSLLEAKQGEVRQQSLEVIPVPAYLRHDYNECQDDPDLNSQTKLIEKMRRYLKGEPVVLALLVRCFLLGILLVLVGIPVLRLLSPRVVNLGVNGQMEWIWIVVLFLFPLVIQLFFRLRRHFKRIRRIRFRLLALTLKSVNEKLSALLYKSTLDVYDKLIAECDHQTRLIEEVGRHLKLNQDGPSVEMLPQTLFCQNLLDGSFLEESLVTDIRATEARLRRPSASGERCILSELTQEDLLGLLKALFRNVDIVAAADMSTVTEEELPERCERLMELWYDECGTNWLDLEHFSNISGMLDHLGVNLDLEPLKKIAALNGMFVQGIGSNSPVVRVAEPAECLSGTIMLHDRSDGDNLYYTTWQALPRGIDSRAVCNCELATQPPITFADRLVLYYTFFRKQDLAYRLAGFPVQIAKEEMMKLDELKTKK